METVLYRLIQDYKREVDALALVVFYGSHYFFIPGLTFASILMFFFLLIKQEGTQNRGNKFVLRV